MENTIRIRVKALSNLFIGGAPVPFEIGGIDQWTVVDGEGFPYIPASSLKGALLAIVGEDASEKAMEIGQLYQELLINEKNKNEKQIEKLCKDKADKENKEMKSRIEKRYENAINHASAKNLFGIREFNNTPKLLFNDLYLCKEYQDLEKCFSIDAKTSINYEENKPRSNPRTYKTVRKGVEFEGEIELYRFESEYFGRDVREICKEYIVQVLKKFNDGVHRLGNSKSRGYGKIYVSIVEDDGRE